MKTKPTNRPIFREFTYTLHGAECSKTDLKKRICSEWNHDNGCENLKLRENLWARRAAPARKRVMALQGGPDRMLLAAH